MCRYCKVPPVRPDVASLFKFCKGGYLVFDKIKDYFGILLCGGENFPCFKLPNIENIKSRHLVTLVATHASKYRVKIYLTSTLTLVLCQA